MLAFQVVEQVGHRLLALELFVVAYFFVVCTGNFTPSSVLNIVFRFVFIGNE
ncbi:MULTISPECIES: hypothetical protein [Alkalihalophilus]|uniref:Uncharacterized protein n=1 Tax=Alkalihalophilus marmarensis DSM 21297 TaxID=1188261 RepID=U6SJF6_9BACI|nr:MULTISPECIES: hypothetical protein [Alkalihalophilus]ERN51512.1 hypothetical protein A33I_20290 [Alkalihalophilus marmarensis DSM 21297]MED1603329.1 hypothetical protein [Alkalihalophilus marmarensis]WEG19253.1 hypothetical protein PQ478_21440 [Alkalihalophilus pseudofirmus]